MGIEQFQAVVLKSHETGNTSEVIHTISAEFGRLSVYAKGFQRAKNPLRGVLQPLALVEISVYLKDGSEMGTLKEASAIDEHSALLSDFERLSLGLLLAEAASESCEPAQPAPEVFGALLEGLHELDPRGDTSALTAACRAFLNLLSASGYEPRIDEALLEVGGSGPKPLVFWLNLETALVHARLAPPPREPKWPVARSARSAEHPLPPSAVRFIHELGRGRVKALGAADGTQLLDALVSLCEYHHERRLKAGEFWRKTFGPGIAGP